MKSAYSFQKGYTAKCPKEPASFSYTGTYVLVKYNVYHFKNTSNIALQKNCCYFTGLKAKWFVK